MLGLNRNILKLFYSAPRPYFFATSKTGRQKKKDYSVLSYYEILSVSPSASQKQIKASYYELAKKYHPDTYKGTDTEYFKFIQQAYEILKNPEKRKEYDMKNNVGTGREAPDYDNPSASRSEENKKEMFDDIKVDENMNFDHEYERFFGKPIKHHPDTIVGQEHIFLEQLSPEERMRYEYKFMKNNMKMHILKYSHRDEFDEIVDKSIQMANVKFETSDEVKQKIHEHREKTYNKTIFYFQMAALLALVPAGLMAMHRIIKRQEKDMHNLISLVKQEEEFQVRQLQRNFVFEDEK